jgi:hypothetical protein
MGPLASPEINTDGDVTFRIRAPKATEIKVAGQFGPDVRLTKDDQGNWSVTVATVPAGIHEYHFDVDCLRQEGFSVPAEQRIYWPLERERDPLRIHGDRRGPLVACLAKLPGRVRPAAVSVIV